MAVQIVSSGEANKLIVDPQGSAKTYPYHPNLGSNGAYRLSVQTGLITTVAACTATAGHIFAARWGHSSKLCVITNITLRFDSITGFVTAQELGVDCIIARGYSVAHSGGTALTLTGNSFKKRASQASTNFSDIRVATTGALTSGTHTLDPHPIIVKSSKELAVLATVMGSSFSVSYNLNELSQHPIILSQNEGIVVRNLILMGSGGTARVGIEMDWLEVDSY